MNITISNGEYKAVVSTNGAELKSLKKNEKEYLWQAVPEVWNESAPWLFPIVCDARNDMLEIGGKNFPMPRHGFIRNRPFAVVCNETSAVRLEYVSQPGDLVHYPYPFSFSVQFSLKKGGLNVSCIIRNLSENEMLYCVGWHPGFVCPMTSMESFDNYRLTFEKKETCALPTLLNPSRQIDRNQTNYFLNDEDTIPLNYDLFDNDALIFDRIHSRSVRLENAHGKGICLEFPGFEMLGVWTISGMHAPYLCIEPWQGTCIYTDEENCLESKFGVQRLDAYECRIHNAAIWID